MLSHASTECERLMLGKGNDMLYWHLGPTVTHAHHQLGFLENLLSNLFKLCLPILLVQNNVVNIHNTIDNSPALVVDEAAVVSCAPLSRIEIALLVTFVFVHSVLKWLHHPLLKNVMLLHPESSSHDFLHAARSETLPGDWLR